MKSFKKPYAAATLAVFAKDTKSFLLIRRQRDPFKNRYAFPGGYLNVDKENLYQTAVRELKDETGVIVRKKDIVLIDVRSDPKRDPRGHVIDLGFICIIDKSVKLPGGDESPFWISVNKIDKLDFAFDHKLFWKNLKTYLRENGLLQKQ